MNRGDDDGFLGRWSRRKRAAEQADAVVPPDPVSEPEPESQVAPVPATLTEEQIAALPKLEDLVEGSDIRAFLQAGVPRGLRNAALRKMWMLTPAIRDYRDPAVDYAWDWNTPGGVPGDGVAPSPEAAARMLRDLITPRPRPAPAEPAEGGETGAEPAPAITLESAGADDRPDAGAAVDPQGDGDGDRTAAVADDPSESPLPRRRHGSALPG